MVTTLITAIGIFAVRNISQIDMAVGFSRQSAQATALAELGTTTAMAEINAKGSNYPNKMSSVFWCFANAGNKTRDCYHFSRESLEAETAKYSGETVLEPAVAGTETGSFGVSANADGTFRVEMTEKHPTNAPMAGTDLSNTSGTAPTPQDVTLTTFASISPRTGSVDPCADGVSVMAVKKIVRAHIIVPPN
jgi:hypothetical protein